MIFVMFVILMSWLSRMKSGIVRRMSLFMFLFMWLMMIVSGVDVVVRR